MTNLIDFNNPDTPSDGLLEHLERALIAGRMSHRNFVRAATAAGFFSLGLSALADELDAICANQNERSTKLEHWAEASGDRAWGYESSLEIYRRMENWQGAPDARYRGKNGPVWCQPAHNPHPAAPAMLAACRALG